MKTLPLQKTPRPADAAAPDAPSIPREQEDGSAAAPPGQRPAWDPEAVAGRLVEVRAPLRGRAGAGSAALSMAASLAWKAQLRGEPVAWILARPSSFFPPDLHAGGIDLEALVVVRAPDAAAAARAADKLLRSGAFGLVLLDVGRASRIPPALLGRLLALAQAHHAGVVFLTEGDEHSPSLAPLVSLRVMASRRRVGTGRFACSVEASKDKRNSPGWSVDELLQGPAGLP